jgi:site-specific recombinase XerD
MGLVEEWLEYLAVDQRKSANTVATYARVLRTLPDAGSATREDVEAWWASRTSKSVATRNQELSAVRSFYRWCRIWEHRGPTDDPTYRLTAPKKPTRSARPMSRHDLRTLLNDLPDDLRRAVALGAYAGLRVSEAAALHWGDVDRELNRVAVRGGKGDKDRLVGLSALLLDHLLPDTGGNVVTGTDKTLSGHTLQMKVNRAIRAAGVDATFHTLRHRFGTMAIAGGASLIAVSRAMGHSSPTTTAVYVAASDSDLDLIAEAVTH